MPGRPMRRAMVQKLANLGRLLGLDQPDEEGEAVPVRDDEIALAYVCWRTREGFTLKQVADEVGHTRPLLHSWCRTGHGWEARWEALHLAREESAHFLVEEAKEMVDRASSYDVPITSLRVGFRKWYAGVLNRTVYGEQKAPAIQVNIAQLHYEALEHAKQTARRLQRPDLPDVVIDPDPKDAA